MLPTHNCPTGLHKHQQKVDNDAQNNFGSFEINTEAKVLSHNLEVKDCTDQVGFEKAPLGRGVFTTVLFFSA